MKKLLVLLLVFCTVFGTVFSSEAVAMYDYDENVVVVQERLADLGYLGKEDIDGVFGEKTDFAVRSFQYWNNIPVDGVVGKTTAHKLGIRHRANLYFKPFHKATSEYSIVVNTEKCTIKIYRFIGVNDDKNFLPVVKNYDYIRVRSETDKDVDHDEEEEEEANFPHWEVVVDESCCVGERTPHGSYTIKRKTGGFWKNKNYYQYFTIFYKNFGIHSVPMNRKGILDESCLGHKVSQGCIRVRNETAQLIQAFIPRGTKIFIY